MRSGTVAPVGRQVGLVARDVASQSATDDHRGTGSVSVAFPPGPSDGDGLQSQLLRDAHLHLRRLGLIGHVDKRRGCVVERLPHALPTHPRVCSLTATHLPALISTNPRYRLAASAGVRGDQLTEKDALSTLPVDSSCGLTPAPEFWRPVPDAPGYEASSLGRVRSVDRVIHYRDGRTYKYRGRVLRPVTNPRNGYLYVAIGKTRTVAVHRLVLLAFIGEPPDGMECRHLNGVRTDARLDNLTWGTSRENNHDIVKHGNHRQASKDACPRHHLLQAPNLAAYCPGSAPRRACLACARAHSLCRKARVEHGIELDVDVVADQKYAAIMRGLTDGPPQSDHTWVVNRPSVKVPVAHALNRIKAGVVVCGRPTRRETQVLQDTTSARTCRDCVKSIVRGGVW